MLTRGAAVRARSRVMRGVVAVVAAAALWTASGGSVAYWSSSSSTSPMVIHAGDFSLVAKGPGVWLDWDGHPLPDDVAPTPGTRFYYEQTFTVEMDDRVDAYLEVTEGSSDASPFTLSSVNVHGAVFDNSASKWRVNGSGEVKIILDYKWLAGNTLDNATQGVEIVFPPVIVTLTQIGDV